MAVTLAVAFTVRRWFDRASDRLEAQVNAAMADTLDGKAPPWIAGDARSRAWVWGRLRRAYEDGKNRPLWIEHGVPAKRAHEFAIQLDRAGEDGLWPAAYGQPAIRRQLDVEPPHPLADPTAEAARLAGLDLRLSVAYLRYFHDRHDGRLFERALAAEWRKGRDTTDVVTLLRRVKRGHSLRDALAATDLADSDYVRLRRAAREYDRVVRQGGWPLVDHGSTLATGDAGPRCLELRKRLALSGDLADVGDSISANADSSGFTTNERFDADVEAAVRRFQSRHALPVTGRVDEATRRELNVPASSRLRTVEMNLERLRWRPRVLAEPFIDVNIPESRLFVRTAGADSFNMNGVVGSATHPTPIFSDAVVFIDFNPAWHVPRRIVAEEIVPLYRKDQHYFENHNMKVIRSKRRLPIEVDPKSVPWEHAARDTFGYLVRQEGGETNPLGRVKFMCPNEYAVYLHDTPGRAIFGRVDRFQSHGCVRVERPIELAEFCLRGTKYAGRDSIQALIARGDFHRVELRKPIPVHFAYRTAWVDSTGALQFRDDAYGLDARLGAALKSGHVSDFVINESPDWQSVARAALGDSTEVAE